MADTVEITPGTGAVIGTDEVTIGGTLQQVQRVKLVDGTDGGTELLPGSASKGLAVNPRATVTRIAQTPTVSTTAYTAADAVGGLLTFANAARSSGGSCRIESATIVDKAQAYGAMDLVLFRDSITAPTDNAAFDPTDAELLNVVGAASFFGGEWLGFTDNAVAVRGGLALPAVLAGTDLYGVLVARSAFTLASTSDLTVTLHIVQD